MCDGPMLRAEIERREAHIERLWKKWEELIDAKWEIQRLRVALQQIAELAAKSARNESKKEL